MLVSTSLKRFVADILEFLPPKAYLCILATFFVSTADKGKSDWFSK